MNLPESIPTAVVTAAIAEAMTTIRADVETGTAGNIEADAVLCCVEASILRQMDWPVEYRRAFTAACDLDNLIPQEAFERSGF